MLNKNLVAENPQHLRKIIREYVRENETKIYQSSNPHFSNWVEIIVNGQDGNVYLYVGGKNAGGGREIKIGIKKSEFYGQPNHNFYVKESDGDSHEEMLELSWNLFTINRPKTPTEEREYYSYNGGLEQGGVDMIATTIVYIEAIDHELAITIKNSPSLLYRLW